MKEQKTKDKKENIHANHRERLQNQVFLSNLSNMSEFQVLEYILTFSILRQDTNPLAHKLIDEFGSLYNVLDADYSSLMKIKGVGKKTAMMLNSLRKIFYYYRESKSEKTNYILNTPTKIMDFFKDFLESKPNEEFYIACLNGKSELIKVEKLSTGDANSISLSTRMISEIALKHNASMVIIGHNHPQGDPYPSYEDFNATSKIVEILSIFNVPVVDHIIVGKNECYSFSTSGNLEEIKTELKKSKRPEMASRIMNLIRK